MQLKKVLAANPYSRSAKALGAEPKKAPAKSSESKGKSEPQSVVAYKVLPGKQLEEMSEGLRKQSERVTRYNLGKMHETGRRFAKRSGGKSR